MRRLQLLGVLGGSLALLAVPLAAGAPQSAGHTWEGTWETGYGPMQLKQKGASVTGEYTHDKGRLVGTVNAAGVMTGEWSESPTYKGPNDGGPFEFTIAADGRSFAGKWTYEGRTDWRTDWGGSCSAGACRANAVAARTEVTVFLQGRSFVPVFARLRAGGTIRFCNRSTTKWRVFTYDKINKFGPRPVDRGECIEQKVRNPTATTIDFGIFDEIKNNAKLYVVVTPA